MLLVRPGDLLPAIAEAKSAGGGGGGGESKVVRILAGAMKQLKHSRLKPDAKLNSDLVSLVKEDPQLFNNPNIIEVSGWSQSNWLPGDAHALLISHTLENRTFLTFLPKTFCVPCHL